jgi:hypothetical protein
MTVLVRGVAPFVGGFQAGFDEPTDGLGSGRDAAGVAEIVDPLDELRAHRDADHFGVADGLCNHALIMRHGKGAVNMWCMLVAYYCTLQLTDVMQRSRRGKLGHEGFSR